MNKEECLVIEWVVDDGCIGAQAKFSTKIPFSEFEDCETTQDVEDLIYEYVQEDFAQRVTFGLKTPIADLLGEVFLKAPDAFEFSVHTHFIED